MITYKYTGLTITDLLKIFLILTKDLNKAPFTLKSTILIMFNQIKILKELLPKDNTKEIMIELKQ